MLVGYQGGKICTALPTQRICYYVRLPGVVQNLHVVILHQLEPSALSEIQLFLREHILQALVVGIDLALGTIQVVPLDF